MFDKISLFEKNLVNFFNWIILGVGGTSIIAPENSEWRNETPPQPTPMSRNKKIFNLKLLFPSLREGFSSQDFASIHPSIQPRRPLLLTFLHVRQVSVIFQLAEPLLSSSRVRLSITFFCVHDNWEGG